MLSVSKLKVVNMKYLTVFFLLLTVSTANAEVGDIFKGSDATDIFSKGITLREWIVDGVVNMFIRVEDQYYTCSIRVNTGWYGDARIWCVQVG